MSTETWKSIQEHKRKQETLRERFQKRRRGRQEGLLVNTSKDGDAGSDEPLAKRPDTERLETESLVTHVDDKIEKLLQQYLCNSLLEFPLGSDIIKNGLHKLLETDAADVSKPTLHEVEFLLQKLAAQQFITTESAGRESGHQINVLSIEQTKLSAVVGEVTLSTASIPSDISDKKKERKDSVSSRGEKSSSKRSSGDRSEDKHATGRGSSGRSRNSKTDHKPPLEDELDDIEALLSAKSAKEQDTNRISDEIQELLRTASTKELSLAEKFRSMGGSQVREFCPHATREECLKHNRSFSACQKLHFRKILKPHTDESLGDCSFLNTCFHMDTCKYVHYEIDYRGTDLDPRRQRKGGRKRDESGSDVARLQDLSADDDYLSRKMLPPQWINCDIRYLDLSVLGKFSVIMADPPWDIHMELPYGTMQDEEMRSMRVQDLSDDGLMFLWVTGRAMELGRQLFEIWGYKRCDELIWVKTNQLQRLIRTGRTGHWINHGKEHCLIGIKGNPKGINKRLDCDVLVAEVRDTSHKPDEIYGIIERLSPGTRKLELFGRSHNIQPNWVTLGNQLDGVHLVESDMVEKFRAKYPDGIVAKPKPKPKVQPVEAPLAPY